VHIWHGDTDRNVAIANGIYLADTIPGAILHKLAGEGHAFVFDHFDEIVAPLFA
jgi:pimeloyl-ACP methyl ester carboxylesterase